MICHVVLYRMKPEINVQQQESLVEQARRVLPLIPGVRNLKVGRNIDPESQPYSVAFVMDFDDDRALEAYRIHPDHQRFVKEIAGPFLDEIRRFDFRW